MAVKILLVDDKVEALSFVKSVVEPLTWCDLFTLADSREAAACLESQKFDGMVVNARMSPMDGFELTRSVRASELNAGVPIVMLTNEDDVETMREGFRTGVTFFTAKPTSRERVFKLFRAVRGAMERERRRHARLPYRTRVECEWGDHGERHFTAESLDISEGGISLKPSGGLEGGQEVALTFVLPQPLGSLKVPGKMRRRSMFPRAGADLSGPQELRARVRCLAKRDSIRLDFTDLPPAHRAAIQRYVTGATEE